MAYFLGLLIIISAAITPGIQPQIVKIKTIKIDPQPLSITAKGGKRIESSTLQILIIQIYELIILICPLDIGFVTAIDLHHLCTYISPLLFYEAKSTYTYYCVLPYFDSKLFTVQVFWLCRYRDD